MHDTAFHIGTLAMNIYADLRSDSILEVGSQSVNGSLRDSALSTTRYVGIDIEEGEGVDIVVEPGKPFTVESNSFDLVMATSVFEHDPAFWMTFLEMCRATKDGGYIYVSAPSNGLVHRYPQDNWRFYPDSGKALAAWAASQGSPVMLVESFIAKREKDIWNDFVAVFRKGPIKKTLPTVFLNEHVPCTDVITWKSNVVINPSEHTEDMILLRDSIERGIQVENELGRMAGERDSLAGLAEELSGKLAILETEHKQQIADVSRLKGDLNLRESELRQRQEEIQQANAQLAEIRSSLSKSEELLTNETALRQQVELMLAAAREGREREREGYLREKVAQEQLIEDLKLEKTVAEERLGESFGEIASLAEQVAQVRAADRSSRERLEWLREASSVLLNGSGTFTGRFRAILPAALAHSRQQRALREQGIFDAASYLEKNPDVAESGMDPLRHYIIHGIDEGRQL